MTCFGARPAIGKRSFGIAGPEKKGWVIALAEEDIVIIGAGPAGLTAAIYARRAGYGAVVLEENIYGGQIATTSEVENYPGFRQISGADLSMKLYEHAEALGARIRFEPLTGCELQGPIKRLSVSGGELRARAVIIAGGAKRRQAGCPGEERLRGRGVSYCATCDGAFYRGKTVAVIGGGNTALEDALFLANSCSVVHLIHRREEFRAVPALQQAVRERENIRLHLGKTVDEILGENAVESLRLSDRQTQAQELLTVSGVFVAIGTQPDNTLYSGQLPVDEQGYFLAGEDCQTPLPGVFVAGDCRKKPLRQIVTATADGAVAATMAAAYLNSLPPL